MRCSCWTKRVICWALLIASVACSKAQTAATGAAERLRESLLNQGVSEYAGNTIQLLPSACEKYTDLFRTICAAKRYVHLEYFIFRNDSVGRELLRLLHHRVEQGVEVRLLIDAYGNWKTPHPFSKTQLDSIRSLGIKVAIFDPIRFPWLQNLYHRDHRKIVVIDGLHAYTGGMNIADYYIHGTQRTGMWRDMQIRIDGPAVQRFEEIFAGIWERTTGEPLPAERYLAQPDSLVFEAKSYGTADCQPSMPTVDGVNLMVVSREPGKLSRSMRQAFVAMLDAANREVHIVNPYPTSTRSVDRAIMRALRRGVNVRLMVSANMDNRLTPEVLAIRTRKLMRKGAEVYYYEGGFHHTKVMTVDGEVATVGSANMDGRSLRYDYEDNVFLLSGESTQQLDSIFEKDLKQCSLLTRQNFKKRFSLKRRIMGRLFHPLRGLL